MASHAKQAFSRVAGPAGRRSFATSTRLETNYGFIGLGQMGEYPVVSLVATTADGTMTGYPMARNLRSSRVGHAVHTRHQPCNERAV